MILFALNIYILMLMKAIGQLLKTQKITVKRVIKKNTQGGKRCGAGAKPKYNEKTKTVAFRCPISKLDELKLLVKYKLSEWSTK